MAVQATRDALSQIFFQRCFWLFAALLVLIVAVSFVPADDHGRLALALAVPAVWFQYAGLFHDSDRELAWSWGFSAALYSITTTYLVRYVFQPRIMTQDRSRARCSSRSSSPAWPGSIRREKHTSTRQVVSGAHRPKLPDPRIAPTSYSIPRRAPLRFALGP